MVPPDRPDPIRGTAVTRSEEELRLGVASRPVERVRIRKVVVTEPVTITVSVRREEIRFETVTIESGTAVPGPLPDLGADPDVPLHEFVLHEEVPVVEMQVVARERVRVHRTVRTTQTPVSATLRAERVDVGDTATHRDPPSQEPEAMSRSAEPPMRSDDRPAGDGRRTAASHSVADEDARNRSTGLRDPDRRSGARSLDDDPAPEQHPGVLKLKTSAAAAFALALGVAALFSALLIVLAPLAVIFGLIGVVLGIVGMKKAADPRVNGTTGKGVAIGGLVLSVIGLLLGIAAIAGIATFLSDGDNMQQLEDGVTDLQSEVTS